MTTPYRNRTETSRLLMVRYAHRSDEIVLAVPCSGVGVLYHSESEGTGDYLTARLPDQFEGIHYFDPTCAVESMERNAAWRVGEVDETFPTGL